MMVSAKSVVWLDLLLLQIWPKGGRQTMGMHGVDRDLHRFQEIH
jgi:hypothetical protein